MNDRIQKMKELLLSYVSLIAERNAFAPGDNFEYLLWDDLNGKINDTKYVSFDEGYEIIGLAVNTDSFVGLGPRLGAAGGRPLSVTRSCGGTRHDLAPNTDACRCYYTTKTEARKRAGPSDLTEVITTTAREPPGPVQPHPTGHEPPFTKSADDPGGRGHVCAGSHREYVKRIYIACPPFM
jgi:hypothetical protein